MPHSKPGLGLKRQAAWGDWVRALMLAAIFVLAAPTPTLAAKVLWIENSGSATITEFKGGTLTSPGASVPVPAFTNHSAALFPDTAGVPPYFRIPRA